ncbi:AAA family ATPase, partial [Candidatus Woesearchaeota archaeon]|nr:AAA family ATPase [Candidatus Woesearchaeota archaeon]
GKSSIILALEQRGEYIIREAAEDYIKIRQAQGQKEPWTEPDFQEKILELQVKREEKIHPEAKRAFIDRGVADGLAYTDKEDICKKIKEAEKQAGYEKKVFLVEHLGQTEKTEVRREDHEEAIKLGEKLSKIYEELGYEIIKIPAGTVEERLEKILEEA